MPPNCPVDPPGSSGRLAPGGPLGPLVLLTRPECGLCGEMQAQLALLAARTAVPPVQLLDVDSDPELRRRYGLKIPVLLLAGSPVCSGRLDEAELLAALAAQVAQAAQAALAAHAARVGDVVPAADAAQATPQPRAAPPAGRG